MDTRYLVLYRSCAIRVLVRVPCAFCALALLRGLYDMLFAVMSTLFRCDATHYCTHFPDITRMHAYAYHQMHTCPLRLVHELLILGQWPKQGAPCWNMAKARCRVETSTTEAE